MRIEGDASELTVSYDIKHKEWKSEHTALSVDAVSVTFCVDGSVKLKSKDGRLVRHGDNFVLVAPGWYSPDSDMTTNTKTPVFKNQVACCYEVVQTNNKRKGYMMAFHEQEGGACDE